MEQRPRWRVVGGIDKGGIVVREAESTKSRELERLATGALVEELEVVGDRLSFRRLEGSGPETGWVSLRLKDKAPWLGFHWAISWSGRSTLPQRRPSRSCRRRCQRLPPRRPPRFLRVQPPRSRLLPRTRPPPRRTGPTPPASRRSRRRPHCWRWWVPAQASLLKAYLAWDGDSEHDRLQEPRRYKGGQLPVMPRTIGLPTYAALPDNMKKTFPERPVRKPMIRLYCFPGAADNYLLWIELATAAPEWCEVAVYEPRAHGFRPDEPWDCTLEERAADAFRVMRPAFVTHARGGVSEGAPFGLLSHGVGGQLMGLVAQRLRRELSLEPLVVFASDGPAPNCRTLSEEGYELLCRDVHRFYQRFQPDTMRQYEKLGRGTKAAEQLLQKWARGLRLFEEHARRCLALEEPVYHKFRCDFHVLIAKSTQDLEAMQDQMTPDMRKEYDARKALTASPPEQGLLWTREMLCRWKDWTDGDFYAHEVQTDHMGIKNSKLAQQLIFKELAGFCGMDY